VSFHHGIETWYHQRLRCVSLDLLCAARILVILVDRISRSCCSLRPSEGHWCRRLLPDRLMRYSLCVAPNYVCVHHPWPNLLGNWDTEGKESQRGQRLRACCAKASFSKKDKRGSTLNLQKGVDALQFTDRHEPDSSLRVHQQRPRLKSSDLITSHFIGQIFLP
jgi:hypothetical protein